MKSPNNNCSQKEYTPQTLPAIRVLSKLENQHSRWLLKEYPEYNYRWRNFCRRNRQFQIELRKRFEEFFLRHPKIVRFCDLFMIAFGVVALLLIGVFAVLFVPVVFLAMAYSAVSQEFFEPMIGWLPIAIGILHLLFLSFVKLRHSAIARPRHFVLSAKYHWMTVVLVGIYSIPIFLAAKGGVSFIAAMCINGLMVLVGTRAFRQTGMWLISRRTGEPLENVEQKLVWNFAVAWMVLVFLPFCGLMLVAINGEGNSVLGTEISSVVHFFESVAAGDSSWWLTSVVGAVLIGVLVLQNRIAATQATTAYKRKLILGGRNESRTSLDELNRMASGDANSVALGNIRENVNRDFSRHRSKTKALVSRLFSLGPLALLLLPWILFLNLCFWFLARSLSSMSPGLPLELGGTSILFAYLLFLTAVSGTMEVIAVMGLPHQAIRLDQQRPISDWNIWIEAQQRSAITMIHTLFFSLPIIAAAIWSQGWGPHIPIGIAIIAAGHWMLGNVIASFRALIRVWSLIPRFSPRWAQELNVFLGFVPLFAALPILAFASWTIGKYGVSGLLALVGSGTLFSGICFLCVIAGKRLAFRQD